MGTSAKFLCWQQRNATMRSLPYGDGWLAAQVRAMLARVAPLS